MSEDNLQSFATAGSGKSDAEVAFDLTSKLKGQGVWGERNRKDILDMFAECLDAVKGLRVYEGQNRVDSPITKGGAAPQMARPAQPTVQAQPQTQAPAPQPAPQAAPQPTPNPVGAQQMQLQQQIQMQQSVPKPG